MTNFFRDRNRRPSRQFRVPNTDVHNIMIMTLGRNIIKRRTGAIAGSEKILLFSSYELPSSTLAATTRPRKFFIRSEQSFCEAYISACAGSATYENRVWMHPSRFSCYYHNQIWKNTAQPLYHNIRNIDLSKLVSSRYSGSEFLNRKAAVFTPIKITYSNKAIPIDWSQFLFLIFHNQ